MNTNNNACPLDMDLLCRLSEKPEPFAPGEPLFWNDPHIAKQMLGAHLNPDIDAASRKPETIERIVRHLVGWLGLKPGNRVLDIGCGPGLYCKRLAGYGLDVTGMDFSENSLEYARKDAKENGLSIRYIYRNYLEMDFEDEFDAVFLVYGDYCVLSDSQRAALLKKVHKALKAGGSFIFDVTTRELRRTHGVKNGWYAAQGGFWKPGLHLVLETGFDYPELDLYLDQYIVVEGSGKTSVYRNWFRDFSKDTIRPELEKGGFQPLEFWGNLAGDPYEDNGEWIGIAARKLG